MDKTHTSRRRLMRSIGARVGHGHDNLVPPVIVEEVPSSKGSTLVDDEVGIRIRDIIHDLPGSHKDRAVP